MRRPPRLTLSISDAEIAARYLAGATMTELAAECDVSISTIHNRLRERSRAERLRERGRAERRVTEHELQRAVADALAVLLPGDAVCFSVDHGVNASKAAAAMRKARGGVAGIPDMWVFWHSRVLPIELKAGRGRVSQAQVTFHGRMSANGFPVAVCRSVDGVLKELEACGIPVRGRISA